MLQVENNYDFRKKLLTVHESNIRDMSISADNNEYEIKDGFKIQLPVDSTEVTITAAKDFIDYLATSMSISAEIASNSVNNAVVISIDKDLKTDYVITFSDVISIIAKTDRASAQALYCLEDKMSTRHAPFIMKEEIKHTFLFSPRMVHPGYGVDMFPDEHLMQIAHAGMDAVLIFVKGVDLTPSGPLDFNELCHRAAKYGIDVYAYSYIKCTTHPDAPEAKEAYESTYGEIFRNCPHFKGLVLVGESVYFESKDEKTWLRGIYGNQAFPSDIPHPGFWPCNDYPRLIERIKNTVLKYNEDLDIVFWTYNWGSAPVEDRISLIDNLPKDISLLVTYEMYEKVQREDIIEVCSDYTLSFAGPGYYFLTEAEAAKRNGIRLYAMANTGGQTWDMGLAPYEPMPYQWMKRYEGLREASGKYGLLGLMESHHYGFYPSFIGDLSKAAFIKEKSDLNESLKEVVFAHFGTENFDKISSALKKWSEAITHFTPCDDDQYGPFRVGPSFPFSLIKLRKPPSVPGAHFGNGILRNDFPAGQGLASTPATGRGMLYSLRVVSEIKSLHKMLNLMKEGVKILESISEEERNDNLSYLLNLGRYICCYVQTGINEKEWFRIRAKLLSSEDREEIASLIPKAEELLLKEKENALEAINYVRLDSRLGWEPSMDYLGDENAINWKIKFLDYVLYTELKHFRLASDEKWCVK